MAFILEDDGTQARARGTPVLRRLRAMGGITETLKKAMFGLMPEMLDMTRDQIELLKLDNVVSPAAKAEGRTLPGSRYRAGILRSLRTDLSLPLSARPGQYASSARGLRRSRAGAERMQRLCDPDHVGGGEQRRQQVEDR